jgi:hypothetical protein
MRLSCLYRTRGVDHIDPLPSKPSVPGLRGVVGLRGLVVDRLIEFTKVYVGVRTMTSKPKHLWLPVLGPLLVLLLYGEATAKIVSLACSGTKREIGKGRLPEEAREPWTFSLILDTTKRTLIVDDYDAMSLSGDTGSKNMVIFSASPSPKDKDGAESASLNRITGETTINLIVDGRLIEVHGLCKPVQKLF